MAQLAAFPKGFFNDIVSGAMPLERWIDLGAELGVDGLELYPSFLKSFESAYVSAVRRRLERYGLEMPMLCHSPDFTHPDIEYRRAQVRRTKEMIRLVVDLGGKHCRVLSGQNRPGLPEQQAMDWVVDGIESVLPFAEENGIVLTIENHYKDGMWDFPEFAQSSVRFLEILERLPSAHLKVQYDPSNAIVAGEDAYELLEAVVARVATIHASDRFLEGGTLSDLRQRDTDPQHGYAPFLKHGVIGEGLNDYDRIFAILAREGFDGWISIEDGEGPTVEEGMENLRRSVAFLRRKGGEYFSWDRGVNR